MVHARPASACTHVLTQNICVRFWFEIISVHLHYYYYHYLLLPLLLLLAWIYHTYQVVLAR